MSRRELTRRIVMAAGAGVCLVLSIVLVLAAADVVGWERALRAGDVSYRASRRRRHALGEERSSCLSTSPADFWRSTTTSRSGKLSARCGSPIWTTRSSPSPIRRWRSAGTTPRSASRHSSQETTTLPAARVPPVSSVCSGSRDSSRRPQEREVLLSSTVASLRLAIALDPSNDEAKHNLELAFQRGRGYQLTEGSGGANPTPGGSGAKGAGAGEPGSGY